MARFTADSTAILIITTAAARAHRRGSQPSFSLPCRAAVLTNPLRPRRSPSHDGDRGARQLRQGRGRERRRRRVRRPPEAHRQDRGAQVGRPGQDGVLQGARAVRPGLVLHPRRCAAAAARLRVFAAPRATRRRLTLAPPFPLPQPRSPAASTSAAASASAPSRRSLGGGRCAARSARSSRRARARSPATSSSRCPRRSRSSRRCPTARGGGSRRKQRDLDLEDRGPGGRPPSAPPAAPAAHPAPPAPGGARPLPPPSAAHPPPLVFCRSLERTERSPCDKIRLYGITAPVRARVRVLPA